MSFSWIFLFIELKKIDEKNNQNENFKNLIFFM
jgi:hypothetical protein